MRLETPAEVRREALRFRGVMATARFMRVLDARVWSRLGLLPPPTEFYRDMLEFGPRLTKHPQNR